MWHLEEMTKYANIFLSMRWNVPCEKVNSVSLNPPTLSVGYQMNFMWWIHGHIPRNKSGESVYENIKSSNKEQG